MTLKKKNNGYYFRNKLGNDIHKPISKEEGFLNGFIKRDFKNKRFKKIDDIISKGISVLRSGYCDSAIDYFNQALKIDSKNISVWNNKGVCLIRMGRYQEAIECFDRAIEIYPAYQLALINKCIAFIYLRKKEESHRYFDQAFEMRE